MKKTYRQLAALALALALSISLAVPAAAAERGGSEALSAAAASAASAAMSYGQAAQIGWAVWQDGEIVESGYDFEYREDPSLGHLASLVRGTTPPPGLYGIGSVSKIYTTVAVLQLAEAGKLDLDQPVTKYLPDFKMADRRYQDITVRMLLNHSSGLMGSSFSSGLLFDDTSSIATDQLLERLSVQRLKADPGAYSVYCNDGFTLAELVVEAVSGMDFMDYLQSNILDPAGLEETYDPEGASGQPVAAIYQGEDPRALPMDCLGVVGAGGLYATAEDAAAFGGALTDETLLTKASLDAMAAPEYAKGLWPEEDSPGALAFGLGWDSVEWYPFEQNGITALVKGGDTQYYHAGLVVIPEYKLAAAVLSSGGVSTYNEMAASQMLIAALKEQGVEVAELRLKLPAAKRADVPKELTELSGYYGSLYVLKIDVSEDGTLALRYTSMPDAPDQTFFYYDDGTFRDEAGNSALRLVEEDNGQTYLYEWAFARLPDLGNLPASSYAAMKLPENNIDPALQEKWNAMMGGAVLPMNERYSSQVYLSMEDLLQAEPEAVKSAPGYVGTLRIEDETHARYVIQCPGTGGRDGSDIEIRRDDAGNIWYYQAGGVYMEVAAAPALSSGKNGGAVCTIQPDGYARWYKIGENAAGKTMSVQLPQDAGFWVYDEKGAVTASSVLWGDASAKLPEGGLIAFAGDPGARFELTFQ